MYESSSLPGFHPSHLPGRSLAARVVREAKDDGLNGAKRLTCRHTVVPWLGVPAVCPEIGGTCTGKTEKYWLCINLKYL